MRRPARSGWTMRALAGAYLSSLAVGSVFAFRESQPSPSLDNVLDRASAYVLSYGESLSTVLAAESYTQRLVWRRTGKSMSERHLRSEIAFIRLVDSTEWLAFRNVLAVNDTEVTESARRLERLFQATAAVAARAGTLDRRRERPLQPRADHSPDQRSDDGAAFHPPAASPGLPLREGR